MRWYLSVWDPETKAWHQVGWVADGVNNRILYATMRGLLEEFKGGQVHCSHPESKREERFALDGDETLVKLQVASKPPTC